MPPHMRHYSTSVRWHHGTRLSVSPVAREKERRAWRKWRTERIIVLSARQNMYQGSPWGYISSESAIKAQCIIQESCYPLYTHCKSPQSSNMSSPSCFPGSCWFTRRKRSYTLTLSVFTNRKGDEHYWQFVFYMVNDIFVHTLTLLITH